MTAKDFVTAGARQFYYMKNDLKLLIILIFIIIIYFLLVYYPTPGDGFDYWHMAHAIHIENAGYAKSDLVNSGYYLLVIILSTFCNISYDYIPTIPFLLIPLVLILILIMRTTSSESTSIPIFIAPALILIYLTRFGNAAAFTIWCHGLGFLIFLYLFYIIIISYKKSFAAKELATISIILLISLNYFSYKFSALALVLIMSIQITNIILVNRTTENERLAISKRRNLFNLALIGITHILTYNIIFFQSFLAKTRATSELESSGLDKFIFNLFEKNPNPLSTYYFRNDFDIIYANTLSTLILILFVTIIIILCIIRYIKRDTFKLADISSLALILAASSLECIYMFLGAPEIGLIIFAGIVGFPLLCKNCRENKTHLVVVIAIVMVLLIINFYVIVESADNNIYKGRDANHLLYLDATTQWIINNSIENNANNLRTDVFTGGFISKEFANEGRSSTYIPAVFSRENMLYLLKINKFMYTDKLFIINKNLKRFSSMSWDVFNGWSNYDHILKSQENLNMIYSSNYVDLYLAD